MNSGRIELFDSPLFLGFEHFEETFDRLRKGAGAGYPPYNIEQVGENELQISLAVAGFTMDDLDVEIENNQLTIRGKQQDDQKRVYLHRGIATRQFQRSFIIADGVKVIGASMDNGLLHIDLERMMPQSNARKIEISAPAKQKPKIEAIDVEVTGANK